jgi:transcriptional regulator with XRE-family HTH domain
MKIDIGHKIKEVFDAQNMKLTDFADELGTVRQNVYRIFKKRHLDTGLLLKISQVLNHNFFQYYISTPQSTQEQESEQVSRLQSEALEHKQELDMAKKEIAYLRKIIKLMEEKAELIQQLEKDLIIH